MLSSFFKNKRLALDQFRQPPDIPFVFPVGPWASIVNLFAVRHALQQADRAHRFGHGKAGALAGLAQGAFIAGLGGFLALEAIDRLINPRGAVNSEIGIVVMVVALVLTGGLVLFKSFVVKKTRSIEAVAGSLHYGVDIILNLAVIVRLFVASSGIVPYADPLFAITIALYMGVGSWRVAITSLDYLMDLKFPVEDRIKFAKSCASIRGSSSSMICVTNV